ncbi:AraC family transcriptional regulator [Agriterribacter sp.]|uniref:AraC family transcriptional regulator n=1 Tax=Agriterribacter sp. TaxID=2821509 RepID=UPI002CA48E12|nr:AraC family transcriptional regulator [Agriterribacter sp.]HRO45006.1 AraC family transcriptional regulator [Agriterribacter sp.]HRQ15553.1 AraC family transcriptional regulator [Agriterribacter sp.]
MEHAIKKKEGFQGQKFIVIPKQVINSKCVKNEMINALYITDIGYYPKAKFHYMERLNGAEQYILIYCRDGKGEVIIRNKEYKMEADDFIIIPIKTPHSYTADEKDPWSIYWVHFKGTVSDKIASNIEKKNGLKGVIRFKERNIELFNEMYTQLEKGYSNDNLMCANMCLWHFFSTFLFNDKYDISGKLSNKDSIDLAIDFLSKHTHSILSLEEIACEVNLSASHFSYLFKKKTGFSPMEYFNHLKVQKACQYLLFTKLRIKEISQEVGIEDQYYFSRMFTKVMGLPPNEYREKRIG